MSVLRQMAALLHQGETIGDLMDRYEAGELPRPSAPCVEVQPRGPAMELVDLLVNGEMVDAERLYRRLAHGQAAAGVLSRVIEPVLIEIGERWFGGRCSIPQERVATGFLNRKLHIQLDAAQRANPCPRGLAIVGTVQGERHEGGVLMFGLMLELAGWRALCLGTDLPVREYQGAIQRWRPDAVGLSFVLSRNINKRFGELSHLRGAPVFVGGRSILNYQRLARQYGLIPLLGSASSAVPTFLAEMKARGKMLEGAG